MTTLPLNELDVYRLGQGSILAGKKKKRKKKKKKVCLYIRGVYLENITHQKRKKNLLFSFTFYAGVTNLPNINFILFLQALIRRQTSY